jgi:hypothetical protein
MKPVDFLMQEIGKSPEVALTKQTFINVENYLADKEENLYILLRDIQGKESVFATRIRNLYHYYLDRSFYFRKFVMLYAKKKGHMSYAIRQCLYECGAADYVRFTQMMENDAFKRPFRILNQFIIDWIMADIILLLKNFQNLYNAYTGHTNQSFEFFTHWKPPDTMRY